MGGMGRIGSDSRTGTEKGDVNAGDDMTKSGAMGWKNLDIRLSLVYNGSSEHDGSASAFCFCFLYIKFSLALLISSS